MVRYTIESISAIVQGQLQQGSASSTPIVHLLTDSRKLVDIMGSLFFALPGPRRSGHQFIPELYAKGVRHFVVDHHFATADFADAHFIRVPDVLKALQTLVTAHRSRFSLPIVGITGSNGKTIVKEWLNQLLEADYHIVRNPKSYNSQIGVPLSVWQINERHTLGIFEAGISRPDEMPALQTIIRPEIGVLTHIGDAHQENFASLQQKISEKLRLFTHVGCLIANGDDQLVTDAVQASQIPCIFWGTKPHCSINISSISKTETQCTLQIQIDEKKLAECCTGSDCLRAIPPLTGPRNPLTINLPFTDDASVENAITCCCVMLVMHYSSNRIAERIAKLKPVEMRLELKKGINNCSVINDSYIADISSLRIALNFLEQQRQHQKRTVILSDFAESKAADQLYSEIADTLAHHQIHRFIGIGKNLQQHQQKFSGVAAETKFYSSTKSFIDEYHSTQFRDETILVKGSRLFELERISTLLELKAHQTVLEVNLSAIVHNLKQYQQLLAPATKIMVMVKAFSYGSGSFEIANILQFHQVDYLAVAYTDEGVELRKAGINLPIMVMNPEENSFASLVNYHLEPELFSFPILTRFQSYIADQGLKHYPVHIKIDTGMHRLGFEPADSGKLVAALSSNPLLSVQSVFSHLAASEDPAMDEFTQYQTQQYLAACKILASSLPHPFIRHLANSAAIVRHKALHFDMVRLGIGLYGIDSSAGGISGLTEAATLKTTIAQIKQVSPGETIGYNRKGKVNKSSTIATIRIGYADGYRRSFSNGNGYVLIRGKQAPVIGNIAMDMTMVDVTDIPGVTEEDEVIVFGQELPVSSLAAWANTIPYEIMTGISQRVLRLYYEE